jgi:hypothetical protein
MYECDDCRLLKVVVFRPGVMLCDGCLIKLETGLDAYMAERERMGGGE